MTTMANSEMARPTHVACGMFVDDADCSTVTENDATASSVCISIRMHKRAAWIQEKTKSFRFYASFQLQRARAKVDFNPASETEMSEAESDRGLVEVEEWIISKLKRNGSSCGA